MWRDSTSHDRFGQGMNRRHSIKELTPLHGLSYGSRYRILMVIRVNSCVFSLMISTTLDKESTILLVGARYSRSIIESYSPSDIIARPHPIAVLISSEDGLGASAKMPQACTKPTSARTILPGAFVGYMRAAHLDGEPTRTSRSDVGSPPRSSAAQRPAQASGTRAVGWASARVAAAAAE